LFLLYLDDPAQRAHGCLDQPVVNAARVENVQAPETAQLFILGELLHANHAHQLPVFLLLRVLDAHWQVWDFLSGHAPSFVGGCLHLQLFVFVELLDVRDHLHVLALNNVLMHSVGNHVVSHLFLPEELAAQKALDLVLVFCLRRHEVISLEPALVLLSRQQQIEFRLCAGRRGTAAVQLLFLLCWWRLLFFLFNLPFFALVFTTILPFFLLVLGLLFLEGSHAVS
jgi:hypothetical protein